MGSGNFIINRDGDVGEQDPPKCVHINVVKHLQCWQELDYFNQEEKLVDLSLE